MRAPAKAASNQAVSAAVVSRPKNRHGRRERSSSTMRAAVIGRLRNILSI
jgi:hypothetical protein